MEILPGAFALQLQVANVNFVQDILFIIGILTVLLLHIMLIVVYPGVFSGAQYANTLLKRSWFLGRIFPVDM